MDMTTTRTTLCLEGLERAYDELAEAIDEVGPEKAQLFLVKLALLSAKSLGDADQFRQHVRIAQANL